DSWSGHRRAACNGGARRHRHRGAARLVRCRVHGGVIFHDDERSLAEAQVALAGVLDDFERRRVYLAVSRVFFDVDLGVSFLLCVRLEVLLDDEWWWCFRCFFGASSSTASGVGGTTAGSGGVAAGGSAAAGAATAGTATAGAATAGAGAGSAGPLRAINTITKSSNTAPPPTAGRSQRR